MTTSLTDYWASGGPLLLPLAVVSFGIWAYFLRSRERLRGTVREARDVARLLDEGSASDRASLPERLSALPGRVGGMVAASLRDAADGIPFRDAFTTREEACLRTLNRDTILLAALTAVAPLLGLLGTVTGMITTFDAVSIISGDTGTRVADGISQALITTQFGLVIAVPGVFGTARLRRLYRTAESALAECRVLALDLDPTPCTHAEAQV
jgi:biopolymer transport protein ExbB